MNVIVKYVIFLFLTFFHLAHYCQDLSMYFIPFDGWIVHICVAIPHVFIHSSVSRHLDYFWKLLDHHE